MAGHDGCNSFSGRWFEPSVGHAQFDEVAMTLMACVGADFGDQWLARAKSAEVRQGALVFFDIDENELGALSRAD